MQRRQFLQYSVVASCSVTSQSLFARGPIERSGPPRFSVGLAAYSLREYFSYAKGKPQKPSEDGPPIDMLGFLDYCVEHGFDAAELTSYFFQPNADDAYYRELKRQAFQRGITISGTAIGNDFTVGAGPKLDQQLVDAKSWIDRAAILGAPHIRFFAGTGEQLQENPKRMAEAAAAINDCARHAANYGIFLGIENHGNLTADQMIQIMDAVDSPWVGINLDTGNFISDRPYDDLERCVPFAVNVQVKVTMKAPDGSTYPADLDRVATILKNAGYQGFVILEYEDPQPYKHIPATLERMRAALS